MSLSFKFLTFFSSLIIVAGFIFYVDAASTCCTIIVTSNLNADFTIDGPQTFTKKDAVFSPDFIAPAGKYLWEFRGAQPGIYRLSVKTIPGYEALYSDGFTIPEGYTYFTQTSGITFNVASDQMPSQTGGTPVSRSQSSFPKGYGAINIETNLQSVEFTIKGPTEKVMKGHVVLFSPAPVGTYTISFGRIEGFVTPPPETKTLKDGATIQFYGIYKSEKAIKKTQPSVQPKTITSESKDEIQASASTTEMPQAAPPAPTKYQRNFFLRFLDSIFSFFRKVF